MQKFPTRFYNLWWLTQKSMKAEGMGGVDLSPEKWKFWINDIFEIEKEAWGRIMEACEELFHRYTSITFAKNKPVLLFDQDKINEIIKNANQ